MEDEERAIAPGGSEAERKEMHGEASTPRAGCPLEAVEGALEFADVVGAVRVDEAGGLGAIDGLVETPVKKHILHVELMDRSLAGDHETEDDPNRGCLDDGLKVSEYLREALKNPARFVTSKGVVGVELVLVNQLAAHNIHTCRSRHQKPHIIL